MTKLIEEEDLCSVGFQCSRDNLCIIFNTYECNHAEANRTNQVFGKNLNEKLTIFFSTHNSNLSGKIFVEITHNIDCFSYTFS